jgi:hypothetical protein
MRKAGAWGLTATLVAGLAAVAAGAADDDAGSSGPKYYSPAPTWQWKPFGGWSPPKFDMDEKKPVEKKPLPRTEPTTVKKTNAPAKTASIVDEAAAERSRQEAALLRRLQVCDKLKEIAIRTNDYELLRRAEELEERAQACYVQRTARLQGLAGRFESDEKTLDRYLQSGPSRSSLAAPHTESSDDRSSRAATKEVLP